MTNELKSDGRPGRVLRREDAIALAESLLRLVRDQSIGVFVEHTARSVATVSNNPFLSHSRGWQSGDELSIAFGSQFGSGYPLRISTNQMDATSLKRIVDRALALLPPPIPASEVRPENPDDPKHFSMNRREYLPTSLWHDTTARAIDDPDLVVSSDVAEGLMAPVERAKLTASASMVVSARSLLYMYQPGLTAWSQDTDCELTLNAYTSDRKAAGWAGQASRQVERIDPAVVANAAVEIADRSRNPFAVEPGRRTAILGPAAVGQLMRFTAEAFRGAWAKMGLSPFAQETAPGEFRPRLGQRVMDARLRMVSDPTDGDGGFTPFFESGQDLSGMNVVGLELPAMTWIDRGVLKELAWTMRDYGRPWCDVPHSARLEPIPGTKTTTIEEMIASCEEGIYVNRFGSMEMVDQRSGMTTGVTRDGCFFIKQGRIDRPVKNFRFLESPFHVFNRLLAVGKARRVALGSDNPSPMERMGSGMKWPRSPMIVPPVMVKDFNFTAMAEAV